MRRVPRGGEKWRQARVAFPLRPSPAFGGSDASIHHLTTAPRSSQLSPRPIAESSPGRQSCRLSATPAGPRAPCWRPLPVGQSPRAACGLVWRGATPSLWTTSTRCAAVDRLARSN